MDPRPSHARSGSHQFNNGEQLMRDAQREDEGQQRNHVLKCTGHHRPRTDSAIHHSIVRWCAKEAPRRMAHPTDDAARQFSITENWAGIVACQVSLVVTALTKLANSGHDLIRIVTWSR